MFPEIQITGYQRGLGRIGADYWPVVRDKRGRRVGYIWEQYPQSLWHSCNMFSHMLNPGPDGPVATTRYEQMREGMQELPRPHLAKQPTGIVDLGREEVGRAVG